MRCIYQRALTQGRQETSSTPLPTGLLDLTAIAGLPDEELLNPALKIVATLFVQAVDPRNRMPEWVPVAQKCWCGCQADPAHPSAPSIKWTGIGAGAYVHFDVSRPVYIDWSIEAKPSAGA